MLTCSFNLCHIQYRPDSLINIINNNICVISTIIKFCKNFIPIRHGRFDTIIPQMSPK